ncbi:flagellar hook-length control protein FliK [Pseudoxanthomonas suwonensis]|uniref:flagellar hook-length control protein FliK n=1 Tax=Pseudoxanthomonas suwonensis TaxID=314722 RepID=UPI00138EFF0D|nr:flagellar hook-length control protein FliK [Pseudoxanthomonas suwonensis]
MNPSLLGAVAASPAPSSAPRSTPERGDDLGFARMLEAPQGTEASRRSSPGQPDKADRKAPNDDPRRQPGAQAARPEAKAADPADEAAAAATVGADAGTDPADEPGNDPQAEAAWPPPGLAWLLQPAQPAPAPVQAPAGGPAGNPLAGEATAPAAVLPGPVQAAAATMDAAGMAEAAGPATVPVAADAPALAPIAEPENGNGRFAETLRALQTQAQAIEAPEAPAPGFVLPGLAPVAASTPASVSPLETPAHLPTPQLGEAGFVDDVGDHVEWLAGQKIGHAVIRISPQDLGPVEVRLHLDGDRLSADFSSAQAEVRQALEQGLPRLREMLGQHGLELAHAGVGHDRGDAPAQGGRGTRDAEGDAGGGETAPTRRAPATLRRGLLDAYA